MKVIILGGVAGGAGADGVNGKVITAKEDSIMKNKTQAVEARIGTARLRACRADREKPL